MRGLIASRAYQSSARHRSVREQEADVFLRVNALLRVAQEANAVARTKALADNGRLWSMLMDLMRDPTNPLEPKLRASVISVGLAVQRETALETPDFGFLVGVNDQIAAGLTAA